MKVVRQHHMGKQRKPEFPLIFDYRIPEKAVMFYEQILSFIGYGCDKIDVISRVVT